MKEEKGWDGGFGVGVISRKRGVGEVVADIQGVLGIV
jgi:hypothetical protein